MQQLAFDLQPPRTTRGALYFRDVKRKAKGLSQNLREGTQHLNSFGLVDDKGAVVARNGKICYADVKRIYGVHNPRVFIDFGWGRAMHTARTDPKVRAFFRWWLQKGPCSEVFIYKNVDRVIENGAWCRTDFPTSQIIFACLPLRYTDEYPWLLHQWYDLSHHTSSPEAAFIIAHMVRRAGGLYTFQPLRYHGAIEPENWNKAMFRRFINHDPCFENRRTMRQGEMGYYPMGLCWMDAHKVGYPTSDWEWPDDLEVHPEGELRDAFGKRIEAEGLLKIDIENWIGPLEHHLFGEANE